MASLNRVMLIGNLGQDPEVKSFQNGGRIATLRIATSEQWKDKNTGERKERTEWHTVTLQSEGLVGVAERFLRKGSKIYVDGQLRTRKWQDRSANDRYSTEVVVAGFGGQLIMLDGRGGGGAGSGTGQRQEGSGTGYAGSSQGEWDSASRSSGGGSGAGLSNDQRLGGGHTSDSGGGSSWGSGGGGFTDDLDDDIPF
jgi:single-strand DNA-binding protein